MGRCQTGGGLDGRALGVVDGVRTFVAVLGACAAERVDPALFRDSELGGNVSVGENYGAGEVDGVEGVHEKGVYLVVSACRSFSRGNTCHSQGVQIILFFLLGVPINSSVAAGVP